MAQPNTCWSPPKQSKERDYTPKCQRGGSIHRAQTIKADARSADTGLFALFGPISDGSENERHFAAFHSGALVNDGYVLELIGQTLQ